MMWQHGKWVGRQLGLLNGQIRVIGGHGRWVDVQKVSFQCQEGWWDVVTTWKVGGWLVSIVSTTDKGSRISQQHGR